MADPTLFLFDGSNLLHSTEGSTREHLIDRLAGFVALRGVSGVVVFDGVGEERQVGKLEVRFADHADDVVERLAAAHRDRERVSVVTSDQLIVFATGRGVQHRSSQAFLAELGADQPPSPEAASRLKVEGNLNEETRRTLDRMRGRKPAS